MFAAHRQHVRQTLNSNVGGGSRLYVAGNRLGENANLAPSALVVLGSLDVDNNAGSRRA
jgi:hypothetical protein